jgi:hypothetical protein
MSYLFLALVRMLRPQNIRKAKQGIALTGFGSPSFTSAVNEINYFSDMLTRHASVSNVVPFQSWTDRFDTSPVFDISNRYFQDIRNVGPMEIIHLDHDVDPNGALLAAAGDMLVHTTDNEVVYRKIKLEEGEEM